MAKFVPNPSAGGGVGGGAPTNATYITQTANGTLTNEQSLASLSTGLMKVTTATGVISSVTDSAGIAALISDKTGSGSLVFGTSPTLVTPNIGVATATSINKVSITAPATSATLTLADGKILTVSNTVTLAGVDGSTITFGNGGTVAYVANNLSVFAATTSAQLASIISDETGSGSLVFSNSPTLVTPTLGAASATSITFPSGTPLANYAVGTYTPTVTLVGGAGNTVPQYTTNTGRYVQIGNRVFVDVLLDGDGGNEGAGTGQYTISLPLTSGASNPNGMVPMGFILNNVTYNSVVGQIGASATTVALNRIAAGSLTAIAGADQTSTTRTLRLNFSYEV